MADVALALLETAVKHLYTLYKKHKDLKREFEEVGNFLVDLGANSPVLKSKSAKLNHVKNTLRRKLESARKQVEEWSSSNSDFFRSDERLRKIRGVRQKVKDAMKEADTQMLVYAVENQEDALKLLLDLQKRIPPQPPKNPARPFDKHPKTSPPRSKSAPRKVPPSPVPTPAIPNTPRRDKTVDLYVPMDSDKQARDVVEKLKALPGVKNAISDQTSKKVSVEPRKGVTLNTDQLLQHAHLENKFVRPTLWSKRPR